jgi:hypothetical protein
LKRDLKQFGGMMKSLSTVLFLIITFFLTASVVHAQGSSTTYVFSQIVDGVQSDGTVFTSRFWISSIGGFPASCNISLFGLGPDRLTASTSVVVDPSSWQTVSTKGQAVVASGYARLDCSQPVFASVTYFLQNRSGISLGTATVPGSPLASHALLPMLLNGRYRYGIALANDNDAPLLAALSFSAPASSWILPIQVPARSQYVKFVDEIFPVPSDGMGTFEILANGSVGSASFNVIGLLFDGATFTTLVPATIH